MEENRCAPSVDTINDRVYNGSIVWRALLCTLSFGMLSIMFRLFQTGETGIVRAKTVPIRGYSANDHVLLCSYLHVYSRLVRKKHVDNGKMICQTKQNRKHLNCPLILPIGDCPCKGLKFNFTPPWCCQTTNWITKICPTCSHRSFPFWRAREVGRVPPRIGHIGPAWHFLT